MDTTIENPESTTDSFAAEIGKSFVISLATTAGMITAAIAIGAVVNVVKTRKDRKNATTTEDPK